MKSWSPIILLVFASSLLAHADDNDLRRIMAIATPRERLAAFESFAHEQLSSENPALLAAEPLLAGTWNVKRSISPMDDSTTYVIHQESTEEIVRGFPYEPYRPRLLIRYREGELEVYVVFAETLSYGKEPVFVTHRIGSSEPSTTEWSTSVDKEAVFFPDDDVELVRKLLKADRLVLRVATAEGHVRTLTFDLTGLAQAIEPVSQEIARKQQQYR